MLYGDSIFNGGSVKLKNKLNGDIMMAVVFLIVATVYLVEALRMPPPISYGIPGPSLVPLVLVTIMYAASLAILVQGFTRGKKLILDWKRIKNPIMVIGMTGIYIGMLSQAGYWISTLLFSFGVALLFRYGRGSKARALVFSTIIAMIMVLLGYLFFEVLFNVRLPEGMW
ncbi:hypothetical protein ES705_45348 [subsurface metagenome]